MAHFNVFDCTDYKLFLEALIEANERGYQTELARAAGCHSSYISQVLNGKAHLTSDQIFGIARHLEMTEVETDYFLLLADLAKSVNEEFKDRIHKRMQTLKKENLQTAKYFSRETLNELNRSTYYSSWAYGAVRHFLRTDKGSTEKEIAERFFLYPDYARQVLEDLQRFGLAKFTDGGWVRTATGSLSLPYDSPFYLINHLNWRVKAIEETLRGNPSYSFSGITCVSEQENREVRKVIERTVNGWSRSVKDMMDGDQIYLFGIDWVKI